jgi:endonuclease/exonuclease/phosphatase (EEP) superfamily protein YafD
MFRVVNVVQQIMTELKGAISEQAKIMAITKLSSTSCRKMTNRVHRLLKVIAFNVNGSWRQRYQFSKQLQDLHLDVALFSETSKAS